MSEKWASVEFLHFYIAAKQVYLTFCQAYSNSTYPYGEANEKYLMVWEFWYFEIYTGNKGTCKLQK